MNRALLCFTGAAALLALPFMSAHAAEPAPHEPYGIGLEGFAYPYPVSMLPLVNDGEQVRMAYMDVAPAQPNGRTVVLLHGRNFPSSYWAPVIKTLNEAGYRVVVPDQIGFGKSSKPTGELHFDTLARNTIALLDHLQIAKFDIVAHSMGGMLGVRITRAYPDRVSHLLLAAPIGLEDYRFYVPPTPTEKILEKEDKLTAEGYRKQLEVNYSLKLPPDQVTPFIESRFNIKGSRRLSALAARLRQFGADDLPRAGGARDSADHAADAVHHGRRRSQRAGPAERAGGVAAEDGPERRTRQGAGGQNAGRACRSNPEYRASGISRSAAKI